MLEDEVGAAAELSFVPREPASLSRFGDGDREKVYRYLLMLAAFLEGKPENTKRTYRTGIKQFFTLFDWICPEKVTAAHAVAFKKWLLEHKRVSETTTYYRLSALKSFFDFLRQPLGTNDKPLIQSNPFDLVARNDIKPTPYGRAKPVTWKTFEKLVSTIPPSDIGLRDKAILLFFAYTGRRRAEVANLRIRDLDLKARPRRYTVKLKGGKVQTFELPQICYDAIRAYWIAGDRLRRLKPDAGVFTAISGCHLTSHLDPDKPLSTRTMNYIVQRAAERAGISPQEVRVHGLRHMAAHDLDRAGVRLQDIQAFLGHANANTTQVYLQKLSGPVPSQEDTLRKIRDYAAKLGTEASRGT